MGKKQRRKQQPQRPISQSVSPVSAPSVAATGSPEEHRRPVAAVQSSGKARPGTTWLEFEPRYSYVNAELKQIGILAGSFLLVLLVLTAILG